MKEVSLNKKEVISGARISRESLYYTILFGLGAMVAAALIYIGVTKANKGLMIYSIVILPMLFIAALISARFACVSKNTVYKKNDRLVVKSFFITRKYKICDIEKLTAAQNGTSGITSVNVTYRAKTANYRFKTITKEEVAHLRRAASDR